jgi:hypothetical protein
VPVIVTTTHFSTKVCAERSRRAQDMGAAMLMVMPPYHGATFRVPETQIFDFYARLSDAVDIPIMVQDAPASGTVLSAPFLAMMATEIEHVAYFKIETAGAASKLRELIRLGGDAIEGPWDGEEAITLMPDLDAGATGSMTGGAYADGIRPIIMDHLAGRREAAFARYQQWLPLINYEKPAGRLARLQGADEGGRGDQLRGPAPSFAGDASRHARRPDRNGAAPRSAGAALGPLRGAAQRFDRFQNGCASAILPSASRHSSALAGCRAASQPTANHARPSRWAVSR